MSAIRITKIIHKTQLDDYVKDQNICRISIVRRKNNLSNPNLLKVELFILVDKQKFHNLIEQCKVISKNNKIGNGVNSFLNGLGNAKVCGFISCGNIIKLQSIELEYNLNLSLPHIYLELITKYK